MKKSLFVIALLVSGLVLVGVGYDFFSQNEHLLIERNQKSKSLTTWSSYYDIMEGASPDWYVETALSYMKQDGQVHQAVDLGFGVGHNALDLLKRGWKITAIDANWEAVARLSERVRKEDPSNVNMKIVLSRFEDLQAFPPCRFFLASRSLPFANADNFPLLWQKIKASLKPGGIFCGTFYGDQHLLEIVPPKQSIMRLTRAQVEDLFKDDFEVLQLSERIKFKSNHGKKQLGDGSEAYPQYKHGFVVVARKK